MAQMSDDRLNIQRVRLDLERERRNAFDGVQIMPAIEEGRPTRARQCTEKANRPRSRGIKAVELAILDFNAIKNGEFRRI